MKENTYSEEKHNQEGKINECVTLFTSGQHRELTSPTAAWFTNMNECNDNIGISDTTEKHEYKPNIGTTWHGCFPS